MVLKKWNVLLEKNKHSQLYMELVLTQYGSIYREVRKRAEGSIFNNNKISFVGKSVKIFIKVMAHVILRWVRNVDSNLKIKLNFFLKSYNLKIISQTK